MCGEETNDQNGKEADGHRRCREPSRQHNALDNDSSAQNDLDVQTINR